MTAAYLSHRVELGHLRPGLDVENTARAVDGMILGATIAGFNNPELDTSCAVEAIRRLMYDGMTAGS